MVVIMFLHLVTFFKVIQGQRSRSRSAPITRFPNSTL